MNIILFGAPGVGKGTQAEILATRLGISHISTGAIFRAAIADGSDVGKQVKQLMDAGRLVPDELVTAVAVEALDGDGASHGFILDGYPRNVNQASALDTALTAKGKKIDRVIYLTAPLEALVERMLKRGRADDTEEVIRTRFAIYEEETAPVLDYYREKGMVTEVNGVGEIDDVQRRILGSLGVNGAASTTNVSTGNIASN